MGVLDVFAPGACAACGEGGWDGLCRVCRDELDGLFDPRRFLCRGGNGYADGMAALFHYAHALPKTLILDFKGNGYDDFREIFRPYLARAVETDLLPGDLDLVTFCPRRRSAVQTRGFDQARLLAVDCAALLGLPMEELLGRRPFVRAQHTLSANQRRENVQDSFLGEQCLEGQSILLLDDVVTTGATAGEAARTLKGMGAMRVFVLCLAH